MTDKLTKEAIEFLRYTERTEARRQGHDDILVKGAVRLANVLVKLGFLTRQPEQPGDRTKSGNLRFARFRRTDKPAAP